VERHHPDVSVVDVRMPPSFQDEGLCAALEIRSRWPGTPVLVLSQYVEERYATELLSNDTTAVGYLLKQRVADVRDFLDALERVARAAPRSIRGRGPAPGASAAASRRGADSAGA
jgi:DNA-binding NarL/FixJ family response regulator